MDANDIVSALNRVLDLGDTLDSSGIGVSALTNGQNTTRELCQMELGTFLLYIGDGGSFFTDGQAALVNLLLLSKFGQIPASQMKSAAANLSVPDPNKNVTYKAFTIADEVMARQQGRPVDKALREVLVSLYESFGGMMVAFNENPISRMRFNNYMAGLKARHAGGGAGFSAPSVSSASSVLSASEPEVDISEYIPAGVSLTDTQKGYLAGVVKTMKRWNRDHVKKSEIASVMKKETGTVSSGIQPLIKKGILEINDDAEVVLAEKKAAVPKPAVKKTSSGAKTEKKSDFQFYSIPVVHSVDIVGERKKVPAENVLIPEKYKGIHHVKGQPETISPYGSWTIDVPDGFSYTMDPDCAASSMSGDQYSLQIQTTGDHDFSASYNSEFGLTIYPTSVVWARIDDGGDNLMSAYAQNVLNDLADTMFNHFEVLVHTPEIVVQYDNGNRDEECVTIAFRIFCAGDNAGTIGQIDIHGPDMETLEKKAMEMLASVGKVDQEFGAESYEPSLIPPKVRLSFSASDYLKIAPSVKLPVPDGYKATDDLSKTGGRSFIICPDDYPFSSDPMQATVGISGARGEMNLPDSYLFGEMYDRVLEGLPAGILIKDTETWFLQISDHCGAFFQENRDDDEDKRTWALYRIVLFAGKQGFILTMRINYGKANLSFQAASIDARNTVCHWLSHIVLEGDTGEKKPAAAAKKPAEPAAKAKKTPKPAAKPAAKAAAKPAAKPAEDDDVPLTEAGTGDIAEGGVRFDVLRDKGPVIGEHSYIMRLGDTAYLQVPEGVTEIQNAAFAGNKLEVVKLPRSLRILGQGAFMNNPELRKVIFQEGLEQIGAVLFEECPKMSMVQLPDSMKKAHREAFADELFEDTSRMTVYLTGNAARRIYQNKESFEDEACFAKSFVIDGNSYNKISDYILYPKPPVQRSAAPSPASQGAAAPLGNKAGEADRIRGEIARLERERDSVKGLFAGMKRKKLQGEIDALKERLRKL